MNNWCICWFFMHPLNAKLNPICHLLALLGGATIVVVSRLRVNLAQDMIKWRAVVNTVMNLLVEFYVPVRLYVASLVNQFSTFRNSIASYRQMSKRPKFSPLKMRPVR